MSARHDAVADSLGSLRAEGLEPSTEMRMIVDGWADGRVSDRELERAEAALLAGEPLTQFVPVATAR